MGEGVFTQQRNRMPLAAKLAVPQATTASPPSDTGQDTQGSQPTVFTVPEGQEFCEAVEITEPIKGLTGGDSYLFSTRDGDKYRTFIVPKNDPSKQYEILASYGELDTKRHEFRLTFGQGHSLLVKSDGAGTVDGRGVREVGDDWGERHSLIKERHFFGFSGNGSPEMNATGIQQAQYVEGDTWTFMQKDFKTGVITKFTQTGTRGVGRLEIIQGDAVNKDEYLHRETESNRVYDLYGMAAWSKSDILKEIHKKDWLDNGEFNRLY